MVNSKKVSRLKAVLIISILSFYINCDLGFVSDDPPSQGGTIVIPNAIIEEELEFAKAGSYVGGSHYFYPDLGGKAYIWDDEGDSAYEITAFEPIDSLSSVGSSSITTTLINAGGFSRILDVTEDTIIGVKTTTEADVPYTNDGIGGLIGAGNQDIYTLKRASYDRATEVTTDTETASAVHPRSMLCDKQKRINGVGYAIDEGLIYIKIFTYNYAKDTSTTITTDIQPVLNVTGTSLAYLYFLGFTDFEHTNAIVQVHRVSTSGIGATYYTTYLYKVNMTTGNSTLMNTVVQSGNREYMRFTTINGYPGMILYCNGTVFKLYDINADVTYSLATLPGEDGNYTLTGYRASSNSYVIYMILSSDTDSYYTYSYLYKYDVSTQSLTLLYSYSMHNDHDRNSSTAYQFYNELCLNEPNSSGVVAMFPIKYKRSSSVIIPLIFSFNQQYVE